MGFRVHHPRGAYYIMAGIEHLTRAGEDDVAFAMRLLRDGGVASVPGSSFFAAPQDGSRLIRFCFAKRIETLTRAVQLLRERLT